MSRIPLAIIAIILSSCAGAEFTTYTAGTDKDGNTKAIPAQRTRLIAFASKQAMGRIPTPFGMGEDLAQDSTKVAGKAMDALMAIGLAEVAADVSNVASNNSKAVDITNSNNAVATKQIEASSEVTKSAIDKGLEAIPK